MKRIQQIAVLAVLLASLIAACTSPAPTPEIESATITFACMDFQHRYRDLAQEFHKLHPTIAVEFVSVDEVTSHGPGVGSSDDVYKIAAAADTFVSSSHILGWATPQDIMLDLTDLAEQDERFALDDFYPGPLTLFQSGGKLWGLPFGVQFPLIFYNPKSVRRGRRAPLADRLVVG